MALLLSSPSESRICRLCLRKVETYINLFQGSFQLMILELTSLEVSEDDGYPKIACVNCIDELQQACNTRKRILECNLKLKEVKKDNIEEPAEVKMNFPEVVVLDELTDVDDMSEQVSSSDFKEILSGYEDFIEEDDDDGEGIHAFVLKDEMILSENDLSYPFHDVDEKTMDEEISSNTEELQSTEISEEDNPTENVFSIEQHKKPPKRNNLKQCEECGIDFQKDKYGYYLHMLKHKKSECNICGLMIRSDNMTKHKENHTCGPRVCDLCGITCKNMESLRGHIFYMHRKAADEYKCDQCDRTFRMKYKLELHKKKEHIGVRSHMCSICSKSFFTVRDLNHHVKMTHLKLRPHICPHCKRGFSSKYAMKTHVRQHTNETPFKCYVCAEGFRQNVSLRTHLKSKHNIEEAKNFSCEFCDKAFSSEFALKVHLRLHSDDNYKCLHCDEYFQQKIFLVNHLKTVHDLTEVTVDNLF